MLKAVPAARFFGAKLHFRIKLLYFAGDLDV